MSEVDNKICLDGACFVAHVRSGYEKRAEHIDAMMSRMGIPFEYMLRGDICDIDDETNIRRFGGDKAMSPAAKSCALKHILICQEIIARGIGGALVLEDDICLSRKFVDIFNRSMIEKSAFEGDDGATPIIISYEDTRVRFVERSRRRKGVVLYRGDRDRMTGCFYINAAAARLVVDTYGKNGETVLPIDLFHNHLLQTGRLVYLWSHPTVATQGSFTGMFDSGISVNKPAMAALKWHIKRGYRRLLYNLR